MQSGWLLHEWMHCSLSGCCRSPRHPLPPCFFQNILISVWVGRMVNIPLYLGYFIHRQKLDFYNHLWLLVVFSPHVGELMFPPIAYKHCFFMLANSMRLHHSHCFKITQKSACYSELANQWQNLLQLNQMCLRVWNENWLCVWTFRFEM